MAQSLVLSIDVCRGLEISPLGANIWLSFFSGRSWPKLGPRSAQELFFFGVFEKFETFFSKICAHSERYRNLLAGIFEIRTFYGNIAFPLSPVLRKKLEFFCGLDFCTKHAGWFKLLFLTKVFFTRAFAPRAAFAARYTCSGRKHRNIM